MLRIDYTTYQIKQQKITILIFLLLGLFVWQRIYGTTKRIVLKTNWVEPTNSFIVGFDDVIWMLQFFFNQFTCFGVNFDQLVINYYV